MSYKRALFMDAFSNLIWLALFYGIFAAPAAIYGFRLDVLFFFTMAVGICFFLLRRFVKSFAIVLPVHIIVPPVAWYFAPSIGYVLLYVHVAITLVVFSLYQRYKPTRTFTMEFAIFVPMAFVGLALFSAVQGNVDVSALYAALMVFVCVGSRMHIRMTQVNFSLEAVTQTSVQPVEKILAFDYKAVIMLSIALVGMIVLLYLFAVGPAMRAIADRIPAMQQRDEVYVDFEGFFGTSAENEQGGIRFGGELGNPALIWVILEIFFMFVLIPFVAIVVLVLITRTVYGILKEFGLKKGQGQEATESFEDVKEFIRTPKARRPWFFGPRNEHRLRKLFRETIIRHVKKGVPIVKSDTPVQMVDKIHAEDISALAEEYAGVRYK